MEANARILLVVNPISGGSDKKNLLKLLNIEIRRQQLTMITYETSGTEDEKHIRKLAESNDFERVLVAGGDGMIQLVAKAIHDKNLAVGILPAGSANGLASNLKLTQKIENQIYIALGTHFISMDLLSVNDHICLHIADVGVNAELIKNYENSIKPNDS